MLAIFAQRLTEPLVSSDESISLSPRRKRGSIQRTGASSPGRPNPCGSSPGCGCFVWDQQGVVTCSSGGIRKCYVQKCAVRFETGNYNYETGSMIGILGHLTLKAPITTATSLAIFEKNKA